MMPFSITFRSLRQPLGLKNLSMNPLTLREGARVDLIGGTSNARYVMFRWACSGPTN
jgi:hypothetical protein